MSESAPRSAAKSPRALSGLLPFLRPYRGRIALALLFLVGAAAATLALPLALRGLIDGGLVGGASLVAAEFNGIIAAAVATLD